jgi:serine/threonine protein kinase
MNTTFKTNKSNLFISNSPEKSEDISPFIDKGEFLMFRPRISRLYYIENFEYVRNYNDEPIAIGRGGYGKIYLAKNTKDNKEYAIKYISKEKMKQVGVDGSVIQREIDVHIRINHPRIIKLHSFLEDKYNYYLALEYAPNGNLYQYIQKKKGMPESEAFKYFIQVSSAIYFLHKYGYVHRDIKPENILLDKNLDVKLCDFGWCVSVEKGERTTFCGTYEYMAPEMVNDELYDMGIDIWSLGVLLYEMIHGYSPFRAHNNQAQDPKSAQVEIFLNIKNNKYTIDKQISEECTDLIAKLLTTDTKKRIKIGDIFTHPWVVNKEKEYFPLFNRTEIKNKKKISNNSSDNNSKINNLKQLTNKSCNFVYSKNTNNNEIGSNICFIQDKKNIIIKNKNQHNDNINIENNENNNKVNLTESNLDKIIELKKHEINVKKELITKPKADQKESYSKNNFNNMYSKKNKNILPRVNRTQKDIIIKTNIPNMKVSSSKIFENQKIKDIDTTIKLRTKANKNFPRAKSEQRSFIRVRKPELEEYFKKQKEVNDLNIKIKQIKEKRELALNTLREIESKNRREKSIRKLYESIKTNSSYDYYKKNLSLRNKFSYSNIKPENKIDTNINKNKIGSLSIRRFYDKNPNLKDQRSRSFQHLFTDNNTFEKKISSMMKELKGTNQQKSNLTKINFWGDNSLYKNINQNKENIIYPNNDKLKRFRKRVIHISKRNNINININPIKNNNSNKNNGKTNIFTSHRTMNDSVSKNNGNKINNNNLKNNLRENKSIQNIFYNTYYNCQFDKKYHITNSNDFNNNNNNKNDLLKNKYSFLKRDKELKSISSEKNLFKNKKIFEL